MDFISISEFSRKSYPSYGRAYLFSENDDGDATYFVHYNLRILKQCIRALHVYLAGKVRERRELETKFRESRLASYLNHRQKALLGHMPKHPETVYAIEGHRRSNHVSYHTARKDLDALAQASLLTRTARRGRKLFYRMNPNFSGNLQDIVALLN